MLSTVSVNEKLCKGCEICVTFCPKAVFRLNQKGKATVTFPEVCIGCSMCEMWCPDFAIRVRRSA